MKKTYKTNITYYSSIIPLILSILFFTLSITSFINGSRSFILIIVFIFSICLFGIAFSYSEKIELDINTKEIRRINLLVIRRIIKIEDILEYHMEEQLMWDDMDYKLIHINLKLINNEYMDLHWRINKKNAEGVFLEAKKINIQIKEVDKFFYSSSLYKQNPSIYLIFIMLALAAAFVFLFWNYLNRMLLK